MPKRTNPPPILNAETATKVLKVPVNSAFNLAVRQIATEKLFSAVKTLDRLFDKASTMFRFFCIFLMNDGHNSVQQALEHSGGAFIDKSALERTVFEFLHPSPVMSMFRLSNGVETFYQFLFRMAPQTLQQYLGLAYSCSLLSRSIDIYLKHKFIAEILNNLTQLPQHVRAVLGSYLISQHNVTRLRQLPRSNMLNALHERFWSGQINAADPPASKALRFRLFPPSAQSLPVVKSLDDFSLNHLASDSAPVFLMSLFSLALLKETTELKQFAASPLHTSSIPSAWFFDSVFTISLLYGASKDLKLFDSGGHEIPKSVVEHDLPRYQLAWSRLLFRMQPYKLPPTRRRVRQHKRARRSLLRTRRRGQMWRHWELYAHTFDFDGKFVCFHFRSREGAQRFAKRQRNAKIGRGLAPSEPSPPPPSSSSAAAAATSSASSSSSSFPQAMSDEEDAPSSPPVKVAPVDWWQKQQSVAAPLRSLTVYELRAKMDTLCTMYQEWATDRANIDKTGLPMLETMPNELRLLCQELILRKALVVVGTDPGTVNLLACTDGEFGNKGKIRSWNYSVQQRQAESTLLKTQQRLLRRKLQDKNKLVVQAEREMMGGTSSPHLPAAASTSIPPAAASASSSLPAALSPFIAFAGLMPSWTAIPPPSVFSLTGTPLAQHYTGGGGASSAVVSASSSLPAVASSPFTESLNELPHLLVRKRKRKRKLFRCRRGHLPPAPAPPPPPPADSLQQECDMAGRLRSAKKSVLAARFACYAEARAKYWLELARFYQQSFIRRSRLQCAILRRSSEDRLVGRVVKEARRSPGEPPKDGPRASPTRWPVARREEMAPVLPAGVKPLVLVAYGDWSAERAFKGWACCPPGRQLREAFVRNTNCLVVSTHEPYTSKHCCCSRDHLSSTFELTEQQQWRIKTCPYCRLAAQSSPHRLRGVQCDSRTAWTFFVNRDLNAALNIREVALCYIFSKGRPQHLCPSSAQDWSRLWH